MCETYRISHSHYLGGPAVWTPEDRAKAEAYAEWRAECCPQCGTHPDWWDPEKGGHPHALVADATRCPGCEVKEQLRDQIPAKARGLHVFLTPNPSLTSTGTHRGCHSGVQGRHGALQRLINKARNRPVPVSGGDDG